MSIEKMLACSTAHITEQTSKWLASEDCPIACYTFEYGYMIPITENLRFPTGRRSLPLELAVLVQHAVTFDCRYIMLDCDGDVLPGLVKYDW